MVQKKIKYKYARYNNEIVFIEDFQRENLDKSDKFYCISCNEEIIPRLGKIKQKHFAHKKNSNCSTETYLHKLGKEVFYKEYINCLKNKVPFFLEFYEIQICNKKEKEFGIKCNLGKKNIKIDLTQYFDNIKIEKKEGDFIPDILLYNSKNKERKVFFEIAVTHKSSEEKINSKNKIIELQLSEDNDLSNIKNHFISVKDKKIKLINFVIKKNIRNHCNNQCQKKYDFFIITKNGKSVLFDNINLDEISNKIKSGGKTIQFFEISDSFEDFFFNKHIKYKYLVAKSFYTKKKIKNCFLCRYHATNEIYSDFDEKLPIFCKFLKQQKRSNDAVNCNFFKAEKSYIQKSIDKWNESLREIEERKIIERMSPKERKEYFHKKNKKIMDFLFFNGIKRNKIR